MRLCCLALIIGAGDAAWASPAAVLNQWRAERLRQWARRLDNRYEKEYIYQGRARSDLRYRTQILIVDGNGLRARLAEAVLDRLCERVSATCDCMSSHLTAHTNPTKSFLDAAVTLGLSKESLEASARPLKPTDFLAASSRWDLIVCADLDTLERVKALARAANAVERKGGNVQRIEWSDRAQWEQWSSHPSGVGMDASVLCLTDFLYTGAPPADTGRLPAELRNLVAPMYELGDRTPAADLIDRELTGLPRMDAMEEDDRAAMVDGDRAVVRGDGAEGAANDGTAAIEDAVGSAAICCCALITYLEAVMYEHALRSFRLDLAASFANEDGVAALSEGLDWSHAQLEMQRDHAVPGGLDDEECRRLYDSYAGRVRERLRKAGPSVTTRSSKVDPTSAQQRMRVDVSDLDLTMDDLSDPMGGLG